MPASPPGPAAATHPLSAFSVLPAADLAPAALLHAAAPPLQYPLPRPARPPTNRSLVFDIVFPAAWVVHIWFELLLLVVCALDMIAAGVYVGLTDLQFLFRGLSHEQTFCLLAIIGIMLGYVGALCVLATSVFVWRVPRRIVQSSDGKRYWRRSIRQIYHNRYTGLPPDVIFADLDGTVKHDGKRGSTGADSWYQESAYALNTQQRTSWIPPAQGSATAPAVPPNPYSTPYDR